MKTKSLIIAVFVALLLIGCTPTTTRVIQARELYVSTLHELNVLQNSGKIDQKVHDAVEPARAAASKALDDAEVAAKSGDQVGTQTALDAANAAVAAFVAAEQKAKTP